MISGLPISKNLIERLKKKLNVGNLRSIQLNCVPGSNSRKLDASQLEYIEKELTQQLIEELLSTKGKFKKSISFGNLQISFSEEDEERGKKLGVISKKLNTLHDVNKEDVQ